jgi:hypothetical protein
MKTKNDRIFLQVCDDDDSEWCGEVTWCQDRVHEDDVEYIRADIVEERLAESKRDADEFEQVAANHINENERIYKQFAANASALQIALDALNQIFKNGSASCRSAADTAFRAIDKELGYRADERSILPPLQETQMSNAQVWELQRLNAQAKRIISEQQTEIAKWKAQYYRDTDALAEQLAEREKQIVGLREYLERLVCLGKGDRHGNSIANIIAIEALAATDDLKDCILCEGNPVQHNDNWEPLYKARGS